MLCCGTRSDGAAAERRSPLGADLLTSMTAGGEALLAHHGSWLSSPPASEECAGVDTDALAVVVGAA